MDFFEVTENTHNVVLDIKYATDDNLLKKPLYDRGFCYLHMAAQDPLEDAIALADKHGLRFKIFDAWRPFGAQQAFYEAAPSIFSDPLEGAVPHCRGVAIDLTLIDQNGIELDMGTSFDDLTEKAWHGNTDISAEAIENRKLLLDIMLGAGWDWFDKEWWHYQLFEPRSYPVIYRL